MKRQSGIIHLIPLIIIAIVVLVVLFVSKQNQASPTPDNISQETSGWGEYTNTENGVSLKYPKELAASEDSLPNASYIYLKSNSQTKVRIDITKADSGSLTSRLEPIDTVTKNNIEWTKYPQSEYCDAGMCSTTPITYETVVDNKRISILLIDDSYDQKTFDQILSTFKLNNLNETTAISKASIDISNWKTYTDSYSNYSVKYPPDWFVTPSTPDSDSTFASPAIVANFNVSELKPDTDLTGKVQITIDSESNSQNLTIDELLNGAAAVPGLSVENKEKIKVNGVEAVKIEGKITFGVQARFISISLISPSDTSKIIKILAQFQDDNFQNYFDAILSTFKFTQ